jgi:cellulose synthase/poly-beta-1,6-N-acetylglucosamine synthase-like glycosyltransferase
MIENALDVLAGQTLESLLSMFWFIAYIEIPRYFIGGAVAAWFMLTEATRRSWLAADSGISVVIPGHNDGPSIRKTVLSLREQTLRRLQIIVVNDGSTDDTDIICRRLERDRMIDSYVHLRTRGGKAAAVNAALGLARHPLFMVTDSDTTFDRDALAEVATYFDDPSVGVVGGNLRVRNVDASLTTRIQQINYMFSITLGRIVKDMLGFYFVASGAFGMYRTEAVRSIGGWDFGPGEDGDVLTRLRLAGWRARFAPFAIAMTDVPETLVRLARQRLRWDRSMIRNRYRKSGGAVLNPLNRNFDTAFALSFLDTYFFNGLTPYLFVLYMADLITTYGEYVWIQFSMVALIYIGLSLVKFVIAVSLSARKRQDLCLLAYLPFYGLVNGYFLRAVKLYANTNELIFRGSYTDEYVPRKVREQVKIY